MKSKQVVEVIDLPFPAGGLDEYQSGDMQRKGTTPVALNVRPMDCANNQRRGARRPGLGRYLPDAISTASIQCIDTIPVTVDQTVGTGDVFGIGGATDKVRIWSKAAGATLYTQASALLSSKTLGTVDEDGNFYVGAINTGNFQLTKIGTDYTQKWQVTMAVPGSGQGSIFGLAAFDGKIYVWLIPASASSITLPGIYRFRTSDGERFDASAWLTTNNGLVSATTVTTNFQNIAIGGGVLGVVGGLDGELILQQINVASGTIAHETTLQSTFETYPAKIVTDQGGNFYVLTNAQGGTSTQVNKLFKVKWSGDIASGWPVTSTGTGARDIAYDSTLFRLAVVGTGLTFPGGHPTDSLKLYGADTGTFQGPGSSTAPYQPNGQPTWTAVAHNGIDTFVVGRPNSTGSIHSLVGTSQWTVDSGATVTETMWLLTSGLNVASAPTTMQSTRTVRAIAVAGGSLYRIDGGDSSNITSNFCSAGAPVVYSARMNLKTFFTDGTSILYYDASTNTVGTLAATAGAIPTDPNGKRPRLMCNYRSRLTLSGLLEDPQNFWMSAVNKAADWDYAPADVVETQAIAGNLSQAGLCPDIINTLIPYSDDILMFGCDHSIWRLSGDPNAGGRFDLVTDVTGMAWGRPWCKDPSGVLYFFGSRGSVWRMTPSEQPVRISHAIDSARLFDIDLSAHLVSMCWDDRWRGLHVFITPINATESATHYFWDSYTRRSSQIDVVDNPGSWWPDQFANPDHNPLAVHVFDGDDPADRQILMGGRDGVIRAWDYGGVSDDGYPITARVMYGPVELKRGAAFKLTDLQATMALGSSSVGFTVHAAESVEAAESAAWVERGVFRGGRNRSQRMRVRGHAAYVQLESSALETPWAMEVLRAQIVGLPMGTAQRIF